MTTTSTTLPANVIALPVAGQMGSAWTEAFVIPYGDSPEMVGLGDAGEGQIGPEYGTQTRDGTWWILDAAKKRIAHYSQGGGFLDAVDLGPELLSNGQFFTYQGSHGLADGTFVTTSLELGVGTNILRILNGEADLVMTSPPMFGSTSDGDRVYGFGLSFGRLALDPSIPEIVNTDWFYAQTGTRYFVSVDATGLRIELPDAAPPVDRVVPIVAANDPTQSAFAIIEVATTADGNIHVLFYGFALNDETVQLAGFTTIRPDGSLTPVEGVQNPFSDFDPGSPNHLGARFGANQPWMMFVDNDGVRVYQRS